MSPRYHFDLELVRLRSQLLQLWDLVGIQLETALAAYHHLDADRIHEVDVRKAEIDDLRRQLDDTAIELLATQQPTSSDLRIVVSLMNLGGELERIGDHAQRITRATTCLLKFNVGLRPRQLEQMCVQALAMFAPVKSAFEQQDLHGVLEIGPKDDIVDRAYSELYNELTSEQTPSEADAQAAASEHLHIARELERIADRTLNLAEYTSYLITHELQEVNGEFDRTLPPQSPE